MVILLGIYKFCSNHLNFMDIGKGLTYVSGHLAHLLSPGQKMLATSSTAF